MKPDDKMLVFQVCQQLPTNRGRVSVRMLFVCVFGSGDVKSYAELSFAAATALHHKIFAWADQVIATSLVAQLWGGSLRDFDS